MSPRVEDANNDYRSPAGARLFQPRQRVVRLASAFTVAGLVLGLVAGTSAVKDAEATEFVSEFAEAEATGEPVEIVDARTPTDTVYANPSGTQTLEVSSSPIRVRQGGKWKPVDLTLELRDGAVQPKAAPIPVKFSAGGDDALSTVELSGVKTTTSWIDDLPEPTLDGATATYSNVFDGVDLRMSATDGGITQILVVHDEDAAKQPELAQLKLPTKVESGELTEEDGGFRVLDEVGREVGSLPAPTMWDSSGTVRDEDEEPVSDTSAEAIDQRTEGPAEGDDVSEVDARLTANNLELTPAAEALKGDDVTYPVYVDPSSSPSAYSWAMLFKQHPNSSFYKWTTSNGQAVGHQTYSGVSTKRLLFRFGLSKLKGTQILSATMRARMVWSSSCEMHATRVYKTGPFSSSVTWNKQPAWRTHLASASGNAFTGCNAGGRDMSWNVKSGVQESANDRNQSIALGLRAASETNARAWRRYKHTASLRIEYNRPPSVPTGTTVNNLPCTLKKNPLLGRMTKLPKMRAKISDPDKDDRVRARVGNNAGSEVVGALGARGRWVTYDMPISKSATATVPTGEYRFHFRGQDNHGSIGNYAEKCRFFVDGTLAGIPSLEEFPDAAWPRGEAQRVVVGPGDGTDTVGYAWTIDDDSRPPGKKVNAGANDLATVTIPGQEPGHHTLRVWAYDAANNPSGSALVREFEVVDADDQWQFDFNEVSGPTAAADGTQFGVGAAERTKRVVFTDQDPDNPFVDRMLKVTPQTSPLPTLATPLLDLTESFTVGAYLDPAATSEDGETMTAISLGTPTSPMLQINAVPTEDGFEYAFRLRSADGTWQEVRAGADDGQAGTVLVLASYDAEYGSMRLIVAPDGEDSDEVVETDVPFTAPTTSGAGWTLGAVSDGTQRWNGFLDHLHIAQYVALEHQITELIDQGRFDDECARTGGCQ